MFDLGFPREWSTLKKLLWLKVIQAAAAVLRTITGSAPLTLPNAVHHAIQSLTQYGLCTQDGTPTPDSPVDIMCNNGALRYSANMANVNEQTAMIGYYINAQGRVLADSNNWFYQAYIPVKPNTSYTLSMSQSLYYVTISEYSTAEDSGFIVRKNGSTGVNTSFTITTGATTNFIRFGTNIDRGLVTLEEVLGINWMLNLGGMAMSYQPYVEGGIYTDGTPEVLTVSGKNLFDENTVTLGYYYSDTGAYSQNSTSFVSAKIPIGAGVTVTFSRADVKRGVYMRISAFDSSDNWLALVGKSATTSSLTVTGTTPTNTAYIMVSASKSVSDVIDADCQVEIGSTASEYVPYVTPQTVTVPMLLSVDTVKDEWEAVQGPLTHRIGIYVIKGTDDEGWGETATSSGTFFADCLPVAVRHPAKSLFTRYKGVDSSTAVSGMTNRTAKCGSTSNRQRIFIRDTSCADVDALKAKLAGFYADGEPCIVAFALATETTEQGTPHALHTSEGTVIVDVTANVSPVELAVEYYTSA